MTPPERLNVPVIQKVGLNNTKQAFFFHFYIVSYSNKMKYSKLYASNGKEKCLHIQGILSHPYLRQYFKKI